MKTRSITAIFIAAVYVGTVLLSVYLSGIFYDIFVLMIAVGAAMEMCRAIAKRFTPAVDIFVVLYAFLGYIAFYLIEKYASSGLGIAGFFAVFAALALICFLYCGVSKHKTARNAMSTMLAMIYPVTILAYMLGINYLSPTYRVSAILLVFLVSTFTDTFAYLVGSLLKGPKLCPKISPKKTVSGAIGGLIGGIGGAFIVFALAKFNLLHASLFSANTGFNVLHFVLLGFFGAVFTQIGDLIASYLKRRVGIKDYGNILPGHGGVLDRIDGMMFNAVVIYIYMTFIMI